MDDAISKVLHSTCNKVLFDIKLHKTQQKERKIRTTKIFIIRNTNYCMKYSIPCLAQKQERWCLLLNSYGISADILTVPTPRDALFCITHLGFISRFDPIKANASNFDFISIDLPSHVFYEFRNCWRSHHKQ